VIATDINESGIATLGKEGVAETARLDVRSTAEVDTFAKRIGRVDILLKCGGLRAPRNHHGLFRRGLGFFVRPQCQVDAPHHPFVPARHAGSRPRLDREYLVCRRRIQAAPNRYVYGATKAAAAALTRAVAADFITRGVRCNCICPGTIETPSMLERAAAAGPQGREMFIARQPMGRLGTAEEIASLAVYLASDESAFTTGVAHIIDGGWTL